LARMLKDWVREAKTSPDRNRSGPASAAHVAKEARNVQIRYQVSGAEDT
jgi:hypothetical protein